MNWHNAAVLVLTIAMFISAFAVGQYATDGPGENLDRAVWWFLADVAIAIFLVLLALK